LNDRCVLASGVVRNIRPEYAEEEFRITSDADKAMSLCDVVIDFTLAEATIANVNLAITHKKPFVCGTTGLDTETLEALKQAAKRIPVLYAPNTSLSLAAMKQITVLAAKLLGKFDYDIAILDEHHRMKKDAPSGTAKALGEAVMLGNDGAKTPSYAAIRAGHIIGNHEVIFTGEGETIRLHHAVTDRAIFARGAVQAALWLHDKPVGFYSMDDVLGI
jgi:4-hydroxy-tetrahydrodipicolinate reductase